MNERSAISVQLDGRPRALPAGTTLAALVASLGHAPDAVGTRIDVSKPVVGNDPTGCSDARSAPTRTSQRATSVAPFQLAATAPRRDAARGR